MSNPMQYDHVPYIIAAYTLFFAVVNALVISVRTRLMRVQARLKAVDPRAQKPEGLWR